ncbi:MAG: hypothetical protein UU77_C0056G0004 [candidate division WWE3 bacterium GW2011_GWC1_41_7]|uniref:Uncharacterized protein n=3 Tax=Katanobacteria TaxID=422282 RepID=A0A0G0X2A4_UNCKA|nr:MAG: hypothetical protein UU72_C0025G0010 [candidate division WWE3 bacterium GW2011_GWB1_41_6]KKS19154.1 MAG: hypothetical protein UU77_C0056G0004 [candidate division WWE3 bacterium GW2011_GWC1_41_7]KKS22576.1 MAG: hypothetical protein UU80_C0005G0021 [candidate division WWE3 bacterium GW2011_GWA1_41_8]
MSGNAIVNAVQEELQNRNSITVGYDNYQYPDRGDSYANDDTDDSPSEQ